ncbi:hypothetical protein DYB37_003780 [Aphanomyces astaci]|uniref:C2 domain-containing protein n=1 Tax=Aphanomyces astaci TaxID=112090 RepID=A0A397E8Y2_APHAT|nr:hypothetical protein DYB36_002947 [Aphanomyces astaci]RHY20246.1 hypothetical protein DYB25_008544 [Aphanomyces astaci]RHY46591.1 hypothetical protein DYB34_010539 [Aphanomyces astaci]RHY76083.1 hypothetical protein DYB30_002294 [Aphanomyces astaci]RHY92111.1 hypothetical protein DYB35_006929 [Aphanomyces astaci]
MPELQVRVKGATNLRSVQFIGKQDPYCEVRLGGRVFRTRTHDNGGKNPRWEDTFVFNVMDPQVEQLLIVIKDHNWVSDEFIGTCNVPLNAFLHGQMVDQWYPVNHGRKQKGTINLAIQLLLGTGPTAGYAGQGIVQPAYPQQPQYPSHPQPHYGAQPGYPGYAPQPTYPAQPNFPPPAYSGYAQPSYPGAQPGYPATHGAPNYQPYPQPGYQGAYPPPYPTAQPGYPGYSSSQV